MRGRRKPKGPRIVSRYDAIAKVETFRLDGEEHQYVSVPVCGGSYRDGIRVENIAVPAPSRQQVDRQRIEPVEISKGWWLYHDYWVEIEDATTYREDEVILLVKRLVLREKHDLDGLRREIETLERFGELSKANREAIPDTVRMFVWQRDEGKCVRCGNREKLEFDHIIPVADGGSSTERNVQLLCESCNRSKGRSVT